MSLLKNKIVLVTGGAGFIGSHLVDRCLSEGAAKVISYDNLSGGHLKFHDHLKHEPRFVFVKGDIADYHMLKEYVDQSDVVFNEAASKLVVSLKNPKIDVETNVLGNFNLLEIARRTKRDLRIIHASTGSVFGSAEKPFAEDDPKRPSTVYGISKLATENYIKLYCKEYGVKASVIRYFHVFGPRQDYGGEAGVISIFLSRVLRGEPPIIYSGGNQIRCFTFVNDVVEANMMLLKNDSSIGETYNCASRTRMSINELAQRVIYKYSENKDMQPIHQGARMGENLRPIPDTSKIEALGFKESVTFDEGLEATKHWIEQDLRGKR